MAKGIRIGPSLAKKSAGQVKTLLKKRYPKLIDEVNAAIEEHYGVDKGAQKLKGGGKTATAKSEPKSASKKA